MYSITTTIIKWGNSGIGLPKEVLQAALMVENEPIELIADETGIRIQKVKRLIPFLTFLRIIRMNISRPSGRLEPLSEKKYFNALYATSG